MSNGTDRKPTLTKEDVDRIFEKQARCEEENEEFAEKDVEEWYRREWLRKRRNREFPDDALAKQKRWRNDWRSQVARARLEASQTQKYLHSKRVKEHREILKQGVLDGAIQVHETDFGFRIDTDPRKVEEYVLQYRARKGELPSPEDLVEGRLLLGTFNDLLKKQVRLVRNSLIEEYQAETPTDFMLIDLAVSNYFRAMFAARIEMGSLWYTKDYQIEMFDMITQGLQPYLHACQNQLLKVLDALKAGKQASYRTSTLTHETYSRTDINLEAWGLPLLLALADITKEKQEQIDIDEIKHAMTRHLDDINAESIPNSWIGYALARYGFNNKIHLTNGNRYNIERARVLTLLDEDLKA